MEDYAHLSAPADRYRIACEVFTMLYHAEGNTLLLSRVGSFLSKEARASMRELRLRFLTFLHEKPHSDYLHIVGAGGAQSLVLEAPPPAEPSLPRLRSEIAQTLTREAPCLLRTLGSLLSLDGRRTLQVAGMKLSKFIASDPCFAIHDNFVSFAPGGQQSIFSEDPGRIHYRSRDIAPPLGPFSAPGLPHPQRRAGYDVMDAPLGAVPIGADWPHGMHGAPSPYEDRRERR
jgi:hypothetical protein